MNSLSLVLLYLLAAVLGVIACRRLKLPAMLGYLIVGIIVGPNALALSGDPNTLHNLGEAGVIFLMFVIGLEFNLGTLKAMRVHVFGLGCLQVFFTILIGCLSLLLISQLAPVEWRFDLIDSITLASVFAMSSTAIVIKLVVERGELDTEYGRRIIGILLFQDLAVVPLMILLPTLGDDPIHLAGDIGIAMLKIIVVILILLVLGRPVLRWWLTQVAKLRSEELFTLNIFLITLGSAWLTQLAGLSLALGAFIAGMLISETEFKHSVEADIKPFHDILLGVFFISIGTMLDWHVVASHWAFVLIFLFAPLILKTLIITILSKFLGATSGIALRTGLYLAQSGEFGFVLLSLSKQNRFSSPELLNPILAGMVLSMIATPFIIMHSKKLVQKFAASEWLHESLRLTEIAKVSMETKNHVIILGFGRCGQNLAKILESQKIDYVALDLDPDRVKQASNAGHTISYGDATKDATLTTAGITHAKCIAITYLNLTSTMKTIDQAKKLAPNITILVRTEDDRHLEELRAAGATEVVPESLEGSLMLASQALTSMGIPTRRVVRIIQVQRALRYKSLRTYFHGVDDEEDLEDHGQERLVCITVSEHSDLIGTPWNTLELDHVEIVNVRREDEKDINLQHPDESVQAQDVVVLSGTPTNLYLAQKQLVDE